MIIILKPDNFFGLNRSFLNQKIVTTNLLLLHSVYLRPLLVDFDSEASGLPACEVFGDSKTRAAAAVKAAYLLAFSMASLREIFFIWGTSALGFKPGLL
jgi:hypothetical protein